MRIGPAMTVDYGIVTERWEMPASSEQLAMQHCRYRMAGTLAEDKDALEIGCGAGMGLAYLMRRAKRVVGMDVSSTLIEEARSHLPEVELHEGDATVLPFPDDSFDVVLMLEMIYYVADVDQMLDECCRVLRPGGVVFICAPNPDRRDFNPSPFAIRYLNASEFAQVLRQHGFEPTLYGGFPPDADATWDRALRPIRRVAVRLGLIPRSMWAKAIVKRMLYGRLSRLGAIKDGATEYLEPVRLDPAVGSEPGYKNLYAIGRLVV